MWTAKLDALPAAICVAMVKPVTCTWPDLFAAEPLPTGPLSSLPQLQTEPLVPVAAAKSGRR